MQTEHTTQTASMLTGTTTRRGALRFLAGIALATTGLSALDIPNADAKKKSKRKGKKGGNGICGDKQHARVRVPHDGKVVYTEKLEDGKRYRLRVSGLLNGTTSLSTPVAIDAGYIFRPGGDPSLAKDIYGDVDFGLSVDDAAANWGAYDADHVYEREVVGQGKKLALRMVTEPDSGLNQSPQGQLSTRRLIEVVDLNFNLSGSLTVELLCD